MCSGQFLYANYRGGAKSFLKSEISIVFRALVDKIHKAEPYKDRQ